MVVEDWGPRTETNYQELAGYIESREAAQGEIIYKNSVGYYEIGSQKKAAIGPGLI